MQFSRILAPNRPRGRYWYNLIVPQKLAVMRTLTLYGMVERILGRRLVWRLGRWLYAGSRRELQNDPLVNGEYQLQSWLLAGARNDKPLLFIDVGANIGNWTDVLLAKLKTSFSGRYRIHVFEPAPAQY